VHTRVGSMSVKCIRERQSDCQLPPPFAMLVGGICIHE
jgi:hypothetical protein